MAERLAPETTSFVLDGFSVDVNGYYACDGGSFTIEVRDGQPYIVDAGSMDGGELSEGILSVKDNRILT